MNPGDVFDSSLRMVGRFQKIEDLFSSAFWTFSTSFVKRINPKKGFSQELFGLCVVYSYEILDVTNQLIFLHPVVSENGFE